MPQQSIMSWLTRPTSAIERLIFPPPAGERADEQRKPEEPTPPGSDVVKAQNAIDEPPPPKLMSKSTTDTIGTQLPPNVELRACKKADIPRLKQLNSLLLPIPYPEQFYRDIIELPDTNNITLLAVWHDDPEAKGRESGRLIGAIRCRLLAFPPLTNPQTARKDDRPMLYLSTLVLLSPYRGHGIATEMLDVLIRRAAEEYGVMTVGAHVWEANAEGLRWYLKRGFSEVGRQEKYYPRLTPQGAVVLQRGVGVMDFVRR